MKEGISYSFLLNIIILFVFVCAAIITGIFSYNRAFKAGLIITNEIEKFEGYNCISAESISKKLNSISYNLPFNINCSSGEDNCITDENHNYKVYSYNNDGLIEGEMQAENIAYTDEVRDDALYYSGSNAYCSESKCMHTESYYYGIYTYMYTDLPVVSNFLRIPIFSKTKTMIEQRNLVNFDGKTFDLDVLPSVYTTGRGDLNRVFSSEYDFIDLINKNYSDHTLSGNDYFGYQMNLYGYGIRQNYNYDLRDLFKLNNSGYEGHENSDNLQKNRKNYCGYVPDWSLF